MRDAAVNYGVLPSRGIFWNVVLMAFLFEDYATSQQCLQYNMAHFDFTRNNLGVEAASQYYFKKPVNDLTDDEVLEILVMYQNPTIYNKQSANPKRQALFYESFNVLKARCVSGGHKTMADN